MKKVAILASAALAASSVVLVVQPASGALLTRCTGVAGAVSVPGNLVVPRDRSCTLEGTTVLGNVIVRAGADLLTDGATVNGNVIVQADGYADVIDTEVGGAVRGRSQFGVFVEDSNVGGGIDQRNPQESEFAPFVYTFSSDVANGVTSRAGEVLLESSVVEGDVLSVNGEYTDVIDSVLNDRLTVRNNVLGSVVCESEIYGDTLYAGNGSTLQIGGSGATGPCDFASYWGGDVTFNNNSADETGFVLANNIVAGDLAGRGNVPAATLGEGNRVRGEITLEIATVAESLDDAAGASAAADPGLAGAKVAGPQVMSSLAAQEEEAIAVAEDRSEELTTKIEQRREEAAKAAEAVKGNALS